MSGDDYVASAFLRAHPEVAARFLESMQTDQAAQVLQSATPDVAAIVLARMQPTASARCAESLSAETVAKLIEKLPNLTGAALLRHFGQPAREAVFAQLSAPRSTALKLLLSYPPNAVGAWMEPRVLTLSDDSSVRGAAEKLETAEYPFTHVYVLDRDRKVQGAVNGRELLRVERRGHISEICTSVEALWSRESVAAAQRRAIWERTTEAPVVNRLQEFVGVVTYSDLLRQQRQLDAPGEMSDDSNELSELAELLLGGIEDSWRSIGDIVRSNQPTADRPSK